MGFPFTQRAYFLARARAGSIAERQECLISPQTAAEKYLYNHMGPRNYIFAKAMTELTGDPGWATELLANACQHDPDILNADIEGIFTSNVLRFGPYLRFALGLVDLVNTQEDSPEEPIN